MHKGHPSEALLGRSPIVSTGKAVGGGSVVNGRGCDPISSMLAVVNQLTIPVAMMYTRAAASDYDDWERVHGNPGWGSDILFELLKKACHNLMSPQVPAVTSFS